MERKIASKGEIVTCENGHEICDVLDDIVPDPEVALSSRDLLGNWRIPEPKAGEPVRPCPHCGAPYIRNVPLCDQRLGLFGVLVLRREIHVGDEWR